MSRPEFEAVVAQAPKEVLATVVTVRSTPLNNGGTETVSIYAPKNCIAKIVNIRVDVPPAVGSARDHIQCYVRFRNTYTGSNPDASGVDLIGGESWYNNVNGLKFNLNHWEQADKRQVPPQNETQALSIKGTEFDDTVPLEFVTGNQTDVPITGERIYTVTVIYRQIAK